MVANECNSTNESRRTFLKALGVTGAATAGLGTLSDSAAATATSTTQSMTPLDIKADDIVPANKYLSITSLNHTVDEIKEATVLVDDTRISSVKPTGTNTFLVSVFDVLTNTDLVNSENASVEMRATTSDGNDLVGADVVDVVDPTNILSGDVADTVESTGVLDETSGKVVDSVESVDILSESSDGQSQSQMY